MNKSNRQMPLAAAITIVILISIILVMGIIMYQMYIPLHESKRLAECDFMFGIDKYCVYADNMREAGDANDHERFTEEFSLLYWNIREELGNEPFYNETNYQTMYPNACELMRWVVGTHSLLPTDINSYKTGTEYATLIDEISGVFNDAYIDKYGGDDNIDKYFAAIEQNECTIKVIEHAESIIQTQY